MASNQLAAYTADVYTADREVQQNYLNPQRRPGLVAAAVDGGQAPRAIHMNMNGRADSSGYLDLNAMGIPRQMSSGGVDEYLESVALSDPDAGTTDATESGDVLLNPPGRSGNKIVAPLPPAPATQAAPAAGTRTAHGDAFFGAGKHHAYPASHVQDMYRSLLSDERNSINSRNQAYASMAVVAALIAGISITFLVDVKFEFHDATGHDQKIVMQFCVLGAMVVCFLALYATMVLSTQYYLVTRALGSVTTMTMQQEEDSLKGISRFMKRTRTIRHLAVKAVVISVPFFAVIVATYGTAKAGLNGVGYACMAIGVVGLGFFVHAIVSYHVAFSTPASETGKYANVTITNADDLEAGQSDSESGAAYNPRAEHECGHDQGHDSNHMQLVAKRLLQKSGNQVSNFKLVW